MLYYNIANPENFILVGLCVTALITGVLLVVGIIINKVKSKQKQVVEKQKDDEN